MLNSISIIFPLYNEEERLLKFIFNLKRLIKQIRKKNFEIIIVDDGSNDNSENIIKNFLRKFKHKKIKHIYYKQNKGKGYALKKGVEKATKNWILTCDLDFSTNPNEIYKWEKNNHFKKAKLPKVFFGSRRHSASRVKSKFYRFFLGFFFQKLSNLFFNLKIKDTQCGFKLYPAKIAKSVFKNLITYGYAHDVEISVILKKKLIQIMELPIIWTHMEKGKINFMIDIPKMVIALVVLKMKLK
jgi:dolichyl-phosphate beta-glucosyltransferase